MQQVVLFVDDEPLAIEAVVRSLRSSGLKLLTATSGPQGLSLLREHPVAVVVSDQQMPGMCGDEFLEEVARVKPATIRIMLTGQAEFAVAQRAINHGHVHQFLVKPCDPPTLLAALRSALDRVDLERASRELLQVARTQKCALDQLEQMHPGITAVVRDQDGAVVLEPPPAATGVSELIHSMQLAIGRGNEGGVGARDSSALAPPPAATSPAQSIMIASEEWRAILDALDDLICLVGPDAQVIRANRAIERWSRGEVRTVAGRELHALLHEQCPGAGCELGLWLEASCSPAAPADGTALTLDDPVVGRSLRGSCQRLATPSGDFRGTRYLVILRDTTDLRALERDARRLEGELLQAQKLEAIGRLAAGVAHEINTPTQFVRDNLEFLRSSLDSVARIVTLHAELVEAAAAGKADPALAETHAAARRDADLDYLLAEIPKAATQGIEGIGRIASIVRALKAFSHPGGGERTQVDLSNCLESTITVARNEWKYVAQLETQFAPDLPLIDGYPGELNQVFLNLIVNAAQAIGERAESAKGPAGRIKISVRREGDEVELRFADNGPGIPAAIRHRVFEPFFTTKPVGTGTGQGLALARSVVVLKHGGTIDFESAEGQGTTFVIRLPIRGAPANDATPASTSELAEPAVTLASGEPSR
jgi:signal transduction histidine kinase/CheY-like chemotaxis protein